MLRHLHIPAEQLRTSLRAAWLVVSIPLLLCVMLPLVAPADTVAAITPVCVWKSQFGRECPGCGLTSAFLLIGSGDLRGAAHLHSAGLPLFGTFVVNSIVAAAYCLRRILR
jgi:hypothetical protein